LKILMCLAVVALGGCKAESPTFDRNKFDPAINAEFRQYARDYLFVLHPSCDLTKNRESLSKIEDFKRGWLSLKKANAETPFAVEIAIAEADHEYEYANRPVVECPIPDDDGTDPQLKYTFFKLQALLAELRKIASGKPKEWSEIGNTGEN
jgi:hypothetical protein